MKKLRFAALIIIVLSVAGVFCYLYYQSTPAYSLFLIWRAAGRHDPADFERRVDLDSVLGHAFDDIVSAASESMPAGEKRLAAGLAGLFKQPFVTAMKEQIRAEVASAPPAAENGQAGKREGTFEIPGPKSIVKNITDRFKPGKIDYRGTGASRVDGGKASVEIIIFDHELNKDFTLNAKLDKAESGVWRLSQIRNLVPYFLELSEARKVPAGGKT
ncbi:MAG: DUF2939 domain-containing protein [Acidaminococcales bacterium]|jgi:hypothetical protein|nr:DUF2939 domain-containing protein [Acidaminococcales bacterium]